MFTYQRIPRFTDPGARWLQITDGGHYENLGVLALLRRGTQCILSVDATADPDRGFSDLRELRRRAHEELKLDWFTPLPNEGAEPTARFVLKNEKGEIQAVILYVKASADQTFPHMQEIAPVQDEATGKRRVEDIEGDLDTAVNRLLDLMASSPPRARAVGTARKGLLAIANTRVTQLQQERTIVHDSQQELAQATADYQMQVQEWRQTSESPELKTDADVDVPEVTQAAPPESIAVQRAVQRAKETQLASAIADPDTLGRFKRAVSTPFLASLDQLLAQAVFAPDRAIWRARFVLVLDRAGKRLDHAARRHRDPEGSIEARRDRIERIKAFEQLSITFPHDTTFMQWYTWERFEAYRLLGYQMATSYIEPLSPKPGDPTLEWCSFPPSVAPTKDAPP
jgi:hypothetical protein